MARAGAAGIAAWFVARLRRAPLVLDLRAWPVAPPVGASAARPAPGERWLLTRVMRVLVASEPQRRALETAGLEAGRILTVSPDAALGPTLAELARLSRGRDIAPRPSGVYRVLRRLADLVVGSLLLVLLSPLLLVVAVLIRLDSPGPSLFRQRRIGRCSSEFTILKFRTMRVGTPDLASHLMGPGSSRVTRLGRLLRRTSVDELPQLWHLVTGEMTLVGPRPALHNQYDLIAMRQSAGVDALKPGLTGWAQIHGRDDIPLDRKVGYDRYYLEHLTPALDLTILARTPVILFSDRGVF